jgi:two-component system, NarL family, nitrate/nitrite response regulator NarL
MSAVSSQPMSLDALPPRRRVVIRSTVRLGSDTLKAFIEARAPELVVEPCAADDEFLPRLQSGEPIDLIVWRAREDASDPVDELRTVFGLQTKVPIVMMVDRYDAALVSRAMAQGVTGLVARSMSADMVLCVLRLVLAGGTYFPCEPTWFAPAVTAEIAPPPGLQRGALGLTPRQLDVLGYICQGMSNKIIARALGMRETTVKAHVMQIMRRLNADNRTQVALRVSQMGFVGTAGAKTQSAGT